MVCAFSVEGLTLWMYAAETVTLSCALLLQFVGTDQSHHQAPPQAVLDLLDQPLYQEAFANSTLDLPQSYFFSHLSITNQLNAGELVLLGRAAAQQTFYLHSLSPLCVEGRWALCIAAHSSVLQWLASLLLCRKEIETRCINMPGTCGCLQAFVDLSLMCSKTTAQVADLHTPRPSSWPTPAQPLSALTC